MDIVGRNKNQIQDYKNSAKDDYMSD